MAIGLSHSQASPVLFNVYRENPVVYYLIIILFCMFAPIFMSQKHSTDLLVFILIVSVIGIMLCFTKMSASDAQKNNQDIIKIQKVDIGR